MMMIVNYTTIVVVEIPELQDKTRVNNLMETLDTTTRWKLKKQIRAPPAQQLDGN